MATDWIKMRTDLYRDPKVCMIADALMHEDGELARYVSQNCQCDMTVTRNVMRNVTVGALVTLWGVTRHRGKRNGDDLVIAGATLSIIDDITDLPGFGAALASVGWAVDADDGVVLPNFYETYNTEPEKEHKEKNAERQRRHRAKCHALRNVTVTPESNAREEKRREENNTLSPPPAREDEWQAITVPPLRTWKHPPGASQDVCDAIDRWQRHQALANGQPDNDIQVETSYLQCKQAGWDDAKIARSIPFSIHKHARSWIDPDHDYQRHVGGNGKSSKPKIDSSKVEF
jgi:hypothetical protein